MFKSYSLEVNTPLEVCNKIMDIVCFLDPYSINGMDKYSSIEAMMGMLYQENLIDLYDFVSVCSPISDACMVLIKELYVMIEYYFGCRYMEESFLYL